MKKRTIIEYEQEDFDAIRENMTTEKAIEVLTGIGEGWFPYRLPSWSKVNDADLQFYEYNCAIDIAIKALKEVKKDE